MRGVGTMTLRGLRAGLAALALGLASAAWAASPDGQARTITLKDGTGVPVTVFPAAGKALLLWLPSEMGLVPAEADAAARLAHRGVEVWLADTLSARFLPPLPSSLEKIPAGDVTQLVEAARRRSGKTVYLVAAGRGAVPALRGAARWRERHGGSSPGLGGAILLYPDLYVATPEPGEEAKYLPIASHTRLNIVILQGELSPWYWYLDTLKATLRQGGSKVEITPLPGTRDRFYGRGAAKVPLASEQAMAKRLPQLIFDALQALQRMPGGTR